MNFALPEVKTQHLARGAPQGRGPRLEEAYEIGGARYPAVAFVQWLAGEYAATGRRPQSGDGEAA